VVKKITYGKILVLTGESGAGKDTVMRVLLEQHGFERVVTHNAGREPREDEVNGRDYHFVSLAQFEELVQKGELLEHAVYGKTRKGTHKKELDKVREGKKVIWRVDQSAAAQVDEIFRKNLPAREAEILLANTVVVYLKAEAEEILIARALKRKPDEDTAEIKRRREHDRQLWEKWGHKFQHIIVNNEGQLEQTVQQVLQLTEGL